MRLSPSVARRARMVRLAPRRNINVLYTSLVESIDFCQYAFMIVESTAPMKMSLYSPFWS